MTQVLERQQVGSQRSSMSSGKPQSDLSLGNQAFREGHFDRAVARYLHSMLESPGIIPTILPSFMRAQARNAQERCAFASVADAQPRVGVLGWEMTHNAAGRVQTLASLYQGWAQVQMMGCVFSSSGREVWAPIRSGGLSTLLLRLSDPCDFLVEATRYVASNPLDVAHLSKPRAPTVILGLLYKLIWQAKVIMDVDDEELGFVGATESTSVLDYLEVQGQLPSLQSIAYKDWTQIAVGCARSFDAVTVPNRALQARYGGSMVAHARDEARYVPSQALSEWSRVRFGIPPEAKLVLFLGTPRAHKGLIETAQAISRLNDPSVIFLVVGDFPNPSLRHTLENVPGVHFRFLPSQPMTEVPAIVSMAQAVVLIQDVGSEVGRVQSPAKLTDALAMGVPVIAVETQALREVADHGAICLTPLDQVSDRLKEVLAQESKAAKLSVAGRAYFERHLSCRVNAEVLRDLALSLWRSGVETQALNSELRALGINLGSAVVSSIIDHAHTQRGVQL